MNIHATNARLPYEFSLGTPMDRMPAVRTALTLFRPARQALPAEDLSWLVVHGGFGPEPSHTRAMLDKKFRERDFQLGGAVSFQTFQEWLANSGSKDDRSLLRRSRSGSLSRQRTELQKDRSYADRREAIEELLSAAEWHLLKQQTAPNINCCGDGTRC